VVITTTTNGTVALRACERASRVLVGALLNLAALADELRRTRPGELLLVCAGTFDDFALEDAIVAGLLVAELAGADLSDAAQAVAGLAWSYAEPITALRAAKNGRALAAKGRGAEVEWCAQRSVFKVVGSMEARFGKANRVWVMDRGMVSQDNLQWLSQTGRRYVIGTPKAELKRWLKQIEDHTDWRQIREDVQVKICRGPDAQETFLLCRSASRIDKERAMHERFKARIEAGLDSLQRRIDKSSKALDRGAIERQIGRLLERNSRAAGAFSITVLDENTHPSGIRLKRSYRPEWAEWANLTEGVYILRTNIGEWTDQGLWQTYIQLTEAEAAFRVHKSELAMRPIWHRKADRIKAHILICFIAYAMWKTLQQWQSRAGLGHSPRTILEELSRITAADIVLPLADDSKRELRIRCVVRPEREQQILIDHLGLQLPQRLKAPTTPKM